MRSRRNVPVFSAIYAALSLLYLTLCGASEENADLFFFTECIESNRIDPLNSGYACFGAAPNFMARRRCVRPVLFLLDTTMLIEIYTRLHVRVVHL